MKQLNNIKNNIKMKNYLYYKLPAPEDPDDEEMPAPPDFAA